MTQSSEAVPFEMDQELESPVTPDNTCPDCGTDSVVSYIDRYSEYEYCTNCEWSDEDTNSASSREPIGRRDRSRDEA